jgi:pectin methylesterase-like acyl-CoA thioesterase
MKLHLSLRLIALVALAAPSLAFAVLGGDISSIQTDRMQMKATLPQAGKTANYSVHEMQTASGVTVREYVSSTGTIFAVAWQGRTVPDLRQLMGRYFDTYTGAAKSMHVSHTHLSIQQTDLVVRASGHMRSYAGIAYLPGSLPAGVVEGNIK